MPENQILTPFGAVTPMPPPIAGETIGGWVRRLALDPRQPVIAVRSDPQGDPRSLQPVLRAEWQRPLTLGERVTLVLLPAHGGGGGGGSKVLRSILLLAVAAAAFFAGPAAAGAIGLAQGTIGFSIVSGLVGAAVTFVGGLLVNAILPVDTPKASQEEAPSPTYALRPAGNQARLGLPIPRLYGRVRMVPDFAAQPYQEFDGDDQYLMQLFCVTLGECDIEQILIDDTVLWRSEPTRSLAIAPGTVPAPGGDIEAGWIAGGGGTLSYTTSDGRPAMDAGGAPAKTRIARSAIAGGTVHAAALIAARSGNAAGTLRIVERDSGLTALRTSSKAIGSTAVGETLQLRDIGLLADTAWIDLEVGPTASGTFTIVDAKLTEGGTETPFEDIEVEIVAPGAEVTLFPANVETSAEVSGQELLPTDDPDYDWVGPYVANQAGTQTNRLAFDISLPLGLFDQSGGSLSSETVSWETRARRIDDSGDPLGSWITLGTHELTRKSRRPVRRTDRYAVALGRYECRARRLDDEGGASVADTVVWEGLKAYLPGDSSWADGTRLALRARATNQLSSLSARRVAVIATGRVPVWDGETWSAPQPVRQLAWALADMLRNERYGAGKVDSAIDLDTLVALQATWDARGDRFDFVFDTRRTLWDALKLAARTGRSQPVQVGSVVSFKRDEPKSLAKAVFGPHNIVRGTLKLQYVFYDDEAPDYVVVDYLDEETWQPETVDCVLPGGTDEEGQTVELPGIVQRDQGHREGVYLAAANARRRVFPSFETELQGRMLTRGDLVILSHDLPQWGWWGRVVAWDAETLTLRLSEAVGWQAGAQHWLSLARKDGKEWGPVKVAAGANAYEAVIDETDHSLVAAAQGLTADEVIVLGPPGDAWEGDATPAVIGPGADFIRRFLVVEARPRGRRTAMVLNNYDESVYTAEEGVVAEARNLSLLGSAPKGPALIGLSLLVRDDGPAEAPIIEAAWQPSPGAEYYIAERSDDGESWITIYEGTASQFAVTVPPGIISIRVAAFGTLRGPWVTWTSLDGPAGGESGGTAIDLVQSVSARNIEIKQLALDAGWNGSDVVTVNYVIPAGIIIGSTSTSTPALRSGATWPSGCSLHIVNNGKVLGKGGAGGGGNGAAGGDAFANEGIAVDFENYGTVAGGGGGGGRGAQRTGQVGEESWTADGGGGGGGQGDQGGGGGSATGGGAGAGSAGTAGAQGGGGLGESQGNGTGGKGGSGGSLGQPGANGGSGSGGSVSVAAGSGGAAGKYATGDSNTTWTVAGTRLGGVSA